MRRGVSGAAIYYTLDGKLQAVNLGADYTAEHEFGIEELKQAFGVDEKAPPGIKRNQIRLVPSHLGIRQDGGSSAVWYERWYYGHKPSSELDFYRYTRPSDPKQEIVGAWSMQDFGVRLSNHDLATDLLEAFKRKDVAFLFGNTGENPFSRAGLVLAIVSRLPKEQLASIKAAHEDSDALARADKKTGIRKRLEAASKKGPGPGRFYALSPRWKDESKTEIVYFLDPHEQTKYNSGWMAVEDLDAWISGTGKVIKQANS